MSETCLECERLRNLIKKKDKLIQTLLELRDKNIGQMHIESCIRLGESNLGRESSR